MSGFPQLPRSLKVLLLAIYNPVVLTARKILRWARVFATGTWSSCSVCGHRGPKAFMPEAVGQELVTMWGLAESDALDLRLKESLICPWCRSKHRARRIAAVFFEETNRVAGSADQFGPILILNRIDGLDDVFRAFPGTVLTDFVEGAEPGTVVDGVRHEDAQNLTFADGTFSAVIDSETLEHVPDLDQALSEIARVLKPGGLHIFTVPMKPGTPRTEPRMVRDPAGEWVDRLTPRLHHPGGSWGWMVHTEFGADFAAKLRETGWVVRIDRTGSDDLDEYGRICVCDVYVAQKPTALD
jgi:hypothetical protein